MNGDSRTALLWYNFSSGRSFTNPPNAGDNNWKVLAAGDYGVGPVGVSGTADLVWRNADSGRYLV